MEKCVLVKVIITTLIKTDAIAPAYIMICYFKILLAICRAFFLV